MPIFKNRKNLKFPHFGIALEVSRTLKRPDRRIGRFKGSRDLQSSLNYDTLTSSSTKGMDGYKKQIALKGDGPDILEKNQFFTTWPKLLVRQLTSPLRAEIKYTK